MASQLLTVSITTARKVQVNKDPEEFTELPVQLLLPMNISYDNAKDACHEFIGILEEMSKNAAKAIEEAKKKEEEEPKVEPVNNN